MTKFHYLLLLFLSIFVVACDDNEENQDANTTKVQNINKNIVKDEAAVSRLEFPKLKGGRSIVIVYRTNDYSKYDNDRVNYAVEWDCDKKSQRWSCYQMHKGYTGSYSRVVDGYLNDPSLNKDDYWETDYIYGSGYEHGHICPNADRKYSYMANYQTFYMTNMQPQYHKFNGYTSSGADKGEGLWVRMEGKVRDWTPASTNDTLYVCKGGTIDNEDQIIGRINGKLIIPKYFFMACLMKNSMGYRAIGFWAEQQSNEWHDDEPLSTYVVTIDKLEELTGIDFFCNLPDNIENEVESKVALKAWGL